jgi:hypothetical protein
MNTKTKRIGRPLMGASPRVRLTAYVAEQTDTQLKTWRVEAAEPACKTGQVIDRLVELGLASRWSPKRMQPEATP